jgi:hypothetical protein
MQLSAIGFDSTEWMQYQQEVLDVGGAIPSLTTLAPRWAAVFQDDPKAEFLVRTVSVGLDVDFEPPDEAPSDVPNYVAPELTDKVSAKYKIEMDLKRVVYQ